MMRNGIRSLHAAWGPVLPEESPQSPRQLRALHAQFILMGSDKEPSFLAPFGVRWISMERLSAGSGRRCANPADSIRLTNSTVVWWRSRRRAASSPIVGRNTGGQSLQGKQSLVLLRLDRVLSSLLLAEMQKQPQMVPKLGERLELAQGKICMSIHINIVSRYNRHTRDRGSDERR